MNYAAGPRPLSPHDTAIWHTCQLNELIDAGRADEWPPVLTPFAPQNPDEVVFAEGWFMLRDFSAVGDGSYQHDSGFFFATGKTGLALTAGIAAGRAIGNARRRTEAQAAAIPRWKEIDRGQIWVTSHGFRLGTQRGIFTWGWSDMTSAQLVEPGAMHFTGNSDAGRQISWILASDWAELIFTLWARLRHPRHAQYFQGAWVPPGWSQRVTAAGMAPPQQMTPNSSLRMVYAAIGGHVHRPGS